MKFFTQYIFNFLALGLLLLYSCQDVIDVQTADAPAELVVDAWLTNQSQEQRIILNLSQPYFDNSPAPTVNDAVVLVENTSQGSTFSFMSQGNGAYTWAPVSGETIGQPGDEFQLSIVVGDERYSAVSQMNPVPEIDSVTHEFRTDEIIGPDGIYAQFFARDLPGLGDTYWIKTFKNGQFLNKPQELNIAYDAGFDAGARLDQLIFIPPIRELVNRVPDEDNPDDDIMIPPYKEGDSVRVEIHSITHEAFFFMERARDQMINGDNTIFTIPIAETILRAMSS